MDISRDVCLNCRDLIIRPSIAIVSIYISICFTDILLTLHSHNVTFYNILDTLPKQII